jgi:virginiamycin B lyase
MFVVAAVAVAGQSA